jgi:hypothetical protein
MTFGHRAPLGGFREAVAISEDGIRFAGRLFVPWSEVRAFRSYPKFFQDTAFAVLGNPIPRLAIYLRNGAALTVRGSGLRTPETIKGIRPLERIPHEYEDLVREIRRRGVPTWEGPREEIVALVGAFGLGLFGFFVWLAVEKWVPALNGGLEAALILGILVGGVGLLTSPLLARAARRAYLRADRFLADGSDLRP